MVRRIDATAVALHVAALVVWPAAVGWTVFRLLSDRFGTSPHGPSRTGTL